MTRKPFRLGIAAALAAGTLLAFPADAHAGNFWTGFHKYWSSFLANQDGVVMTALVVGAISIFIITRGKWVKR